jgi:hypothetical protein
VPSPASLATCVERLCCDHVLDGVILTAGLGSQRERSSASWDTEPLVACDLLFQTSKLRLLPSFFSTSASSSVASRDFLEDWVSPSKPTTKSKKASMFVCDAGDDGVTRRTCKARVGGCG